MNSRPKKQLGQHFLVDQHVLADIVHAIAPQPSDRLVEIGPGPGALTLPLLDAAGKLLAIELDRDLVPVLAERATSHGELELIRASVLKVDLDELAARLDGPLRMVGNLPYNISSPILFHCLAHRPAIHDMTFLLQKEMAERIVAGPGSKTYGRISVMVQLACRADLLLEVGPQAFRPPPKVDSALIRLTPRPEAEQPDVDGKLLADVVRAAFSQRRKTLANALKRLMPREHIEAAGIDPSLRAEALTPAEFIALARQFQPSHADWQRAQGRFSDNRT